MVVPNAVVVLAAVPCHHLLADGAVCVTTTDSLGDGLTNGEEDHAARDVVSIVATRNNALAQVCACNNNTPMTGSVGTVNSHT